MTAAKRACAYLCPNLQNVLKPHTCIGKLALKQHNNIIVVLVDLFAFWSVGATLSRFLFDVSLQACYLLVDVGNVLFDYEGEFLYEAVRHIYMSKE